MCGIFGTFGTDCVGQTLKALHFLEYRGYDSAGISAKQGDKLCVVKTQGRVSVLEQKLPQGFWGQSAIGHTRWATHGVVCDKNAHPFLSADGSFAVCHNGIIENYLQLRTLLVQKGFAFSSDTDSEVVAHLLQMHFKGDVLQALLQTANMLQGAFALVVQTTHDGKLYAAKQKSPLVVGISSKGASLSSDVRCLSQTADKFALLPNGTVAAISPNKIDCYFFDGKPLQLKFTAKVAAEPPRNRSGDVMLQEIFQIPRCIAEATHGYFQSGGLNLSSGQTAQLSRIYFLGCGTAYNSGLEACAVGRKFLGVDLIPVISSEFVYDNYPVDGNTLAFCISQSGETSDTIRAAEKVAALGGYPYAVTNTDVSSLCYVCKNVKNVCAGGEFAVASTKAYNCQLVVLILLLADIALARGELSPQSHRELLAGFEGLPDAVQTVLNKNDQIRQTALQVKDSSSVFFVGRALDYPTATEGALKLKEISYLHCEAYPSGELKHGTLALMEKGVTVVVLSTCKQLEQKNNSTANEITSRKAKALMLCCNQQPLGIPQVHPYLVGVVAVVPLQLLAYHVAKSLGRDVDKPRNLAKSVTVE